MLLSASMRSIVTMGICWAAANIAWADATPPALFIGDPAPQLDVAKFKKGAPVQELKAGSVYVVEFWATWCGPCRETIPRLTAMQKQYPKATFIGVSVFERDPGDVGKFVEDQGDKMEYRVAVDRIPEGGDGTDGAMAVKWLEPSGQSGIPVAFVIDGAGRVAWIGHPMELEDPLAAVLAGTWDVAKARADGLKAIERKAQVEAISRKIQTAVADRKFGEAAAIVDELIKLEPASKRRFEGAKLRLLLKLPESTAASELATRMADEMPDGDFNAANELSWLLIHPTRDHELAPAMQELAVNQAERAAKWSNREQAAVLDTLAWAYAASHRWDEARKTMKEAIALAETKEPGLVRVLGRHLVQLELAAREAAAKTEK